MAEEHHPSIHNTAFVTAECEKSFIDFLYKKLGLVIKRHQLKSLHDAIDKGCRVFGYLRWQDYFEALQQSDSASAEMEQLIAGVTIGESYFFRDQNQIAWLRENWLPQIIAQRRRSGEKNLRIWSAGCSNGQELYTIAILLAEALPDLDEWNIHLLGTDINAEVLSTALQGHYSAWSFRATPEAVRERHFFSQNKGYTINDNLRQMPNFTFLNLADDEYPSMLTQTNAMDLILCRNVFIYFDQAVVDKIMLRFSRSLVPGAILMLGASDLSASDTGQLTLERDGNVFYYHHCAKTETVNKTMPSKVAISDRKEVAPIATAPAAAEQMLYRMLHDGRWQEALSHIDAALKLQGKTAPLLQHKAKVTANLGDLQRAEALCNESLELDPLDTHSYFLKAIILIELGNDQGAESSLRKTIYLEPAFVEAHFQLGLLLIRCEKPAAGKKSLHNALRLARSAPPEGELHNAAGMTFKRFVEILEHEMEIHADKAEVNLDGC